MEGSSNFPSFILNIMLKRTQLKRGDSQLKRSGFKKKATVPMKRTPLRKKSLNKRKKQTKVGLWREYGLVRPSKPRYTGRKGIYWYLLSLYTRKRDFEEFGTCISCNKEVESYQDFDAGHYAPAGNCGFALLFLKININGECKGCNAFDSGHLIGYEQGLRTRYGDIVTEGLKTIYINKHQTITKEWTQIEYDTKIKELQQELSKYNI